METPAAICATRTIFFHSAAQRQVLIQWLGFSPEEASWESFEDFCSAYPFFHLDDKVVFEGEGNDTSLPLPLGPEHQEPSRAVVDEKMEVGEVQKKPKCLNDCVLINWVVCSYPYRLASFQRKVCFSFRACQGPQVVSLEFCFALGF